MGVEEGRKGTPDREVIAEDIEAVVQKGKCAEDGESERVLSVGDSVAKSPAEAAPAPGLFLKSYLVTVSRSGPRARPEPPSPSPDLGLRMDRATGPASPSPVAHCDGGWPKVAPITRSDRDELEEEDGDKSSKTKRKKKKRKKEPKENTGGKWSFGGLFRRKKKKEDDAECAKDSTEEDYGMEKFSPAKVPPAFPPSPSLKRNKNDEEHHHPPSERLGVPRGCAVHNGWVGCADRPRRSRQSLGHGCDCGDSYGGTALVRRDSSTSSHRERKEMIKARVEAMRERLPKDSSSEDECLPGGSEGSWEWRGKKVPPGIPHGGVGSAGSSPYLGRRSRFAGRTERFHQRRFSREFRDEGEDEEMWRRRANGLPPQGCVPWRASQSDVEAPYIRGRMAAANSGTTVEHGGSTMSYSPAQSPLQSPILSGRRSASSTASPGHPKEPSGLPFHGGNRAVPRRYPSTPLSPQSPPVEGPVERRHAPAHSAPYYPMRSRSTDVLLSWRPEDNSYHGGEPTPYHYPVKQSPAQRPAQETSQYHQRWALANSGRSPPPPPPPRDPQRRINNSQSHFHMREQVPPNDGYVRRHYPHQAPYNQAQQENPYMNIQSIRSQQQAQAQTHQQGVTCVADSQPRSRRPLRVTAGAYGPRSGEMSYMSDSQVGPNGVRRTMTQHPPLESHYAVPFLADSPPPRCVINRVIREPQLAESVIHNPRPLMRQQKAPVFSRSRSSSPAPAAVNNRPALLPLRPFENTNDSHHFAPRGHSSSAPQTPIDGPINRPLSIVSEEKTELPTKVPPVPPARSSSRRSSVSSLEAMEYGMWGMDRNSRQPNNKGPSGLEDALTELENIYKSLNLEDDVDGETDSVLMGSTETGATYDDQDRPLTDDMAYRRLHSKEKEKGAQQGVGGVVAQAGSYLLVSPTLGPSEPWNEPPPNSVNPGEPDITLDDVVFRSIRQANAHMPPDPQPPFGIPLGPVTRAPDSDYLHAKPPSPSPNANRTSSSAKKTPDVVKDDLAFRSLRKDRQSNGTPIRPVPLRGVGSPPPRPSSSFSCVSSPPPLPNAGIDFQAIRKKRAVRSLSANLLGILQNTNLSPRPLSPPPMTKAQLPPPSPSSPRKELRSLAFSPPPTRGLTSPPPRKKALSPPVLASEDSETCANEVPAQGNDATSSDTLTEGHADEPKTKNKTEKVDEKIEDVQKEDSSPPVITDSPGEVYEALGRVLSRVGKEMGSPGKNVKGNGDGDDLETLLVALAKEARTTSENLGRELDQLRTSSGKSPDLIKKQGKVEAVVVKEVDATTPSSPKKVIVSEVVQGVPTEGKPSRPVAPQSPVPAPRIGAIASLARIDPEKSHLLSFAKVSNQGKGTGMSVVVGKCTLSKDSNQPDVVSFTSSVSPLSPSAVSVEMDKLPNVSAPSAEDSMQAGDADVTDKKDSDKESMVSAESAKVPIKSGSMGFAVTKESGIEADPNQEGLKKSPPEEKKVKGKSSDITKMVKEHSKAPIGFASAIMKHHQAESHVIASRKEDMKTIESVVKSEEKQSVSSPKPLAEQPLPLDSGKESDPSANQEIAPIKASMKLVVRRNAEDLPKFHIPPPVIPRKVLPVPTKESEDVPNAKETTPQYVVASTQTSFSKIENEVEKERPVTQEVEVVPEVTKEEKPESMSPGTVVEAIKKDFDQIFAIPAKKPRRSIERSGVNVVRKSRSLERPKANVSVEYLKRIPPKSHSIVTETRPSFIEGLKAKGVIKDPNVSCAFEKEFDELWKASNAAKKADALLDSELERELDQLCSVKDTQETMVVLTPKGSSGAKGAEAEGSGGHGTRGVEDGGAVGTPRGPCDDNRLPTLATADIAEEVQDMLGRERRRSGRGGSVTAGPDQMGAPRDETAARAERMARYKEERRRQLASQFGNAAAQSSSSSAEDANRVRTTRTSRLRAAAAAAAASGSPSELSRRESWRYPKTSAASSPAPTRGSAPEKSVPISSSEQHNNDSKNEGSLHPPSQLFSSSSSASSLSEISRRERDKSGKRKSNLNRALNVEEVPGAVEPSDDGSAGRRRRRRVVSAYLEGVSPQRSPEPTSHSVADLSICRNTPLEAPGRAVRKISETTNSRFDSWSSRHLSDTAVRKSPDTIREFGATKRISGDFNHGGILPKLEIHRQVNNHQPSDQQRRIAQTKGGMTEVPPSSSPVSFNTQKTNSVGRPSEKTNGIVHHNSASRSAPTRRTPETSVPSPTRVDRTSPVGVILRRRPTTTTTTTANVTARRSPRPASYCSGVTAAEELMRAPLKRAQSGSFAAEVKERIASVHLRTSRSGDTVNEQRMSVEDPAKECIMEENALVEEEVVPVATANGRETPKERNGGTPSPPLFGHTVHQQRTPSSILKRRAGSGEDAASSSGSGSSSPSRPVSILKRKAPEEVGAANSVLGRATPPLSDHAPQGILKKRPSLDESESRRSHSPLDVEHGAEFRPILKQPGRPERRLSLEESNMTTGILKRGGRDEDDDVPTSPAFIPGGLVSRVPGIPPPFEAVQEPRPILKRRSGSEENSEGSCGGSGIPPLSEVPPRPILKRRAGSEEETGHHTASSDERPHPRPILKSSSSSASSSSSSSSSRTFPPLQRRSLDEATCQRWRPGWGTDEDRSFHGRGGMMPRRQRSEERPPGILRLRDSSDSLWGSLDHGQDLGRVDGFGPQYQRSRRSDSAPPGDCIRVNSRPPTPPPSVAWMGDPPEEQEPESPLGAAALPEPAPAPKVEEVNEPAVSQENQASSRMSGSRESSRFRTQPVTLGELRELARLETVKAYRGSTTAPLLQFGEGNEAAVNGRSLTRRLSEAWEKGVLRRRGESSSSTLPPHQEASPSPGSSNQTLLESPKPEESQERSEQEMSVRESHPVQHVKEVGSVGFNIEEEKETAGHSEEESGVEERIKGGSVSQRAQLFAQIAEEAKGASVKGAVGANRFRDRKEKRAAGGRFSTQPVTTEEVTEAVRQAESGGSGPEVDDNDPSKLSLAERVRLFNQKILEERLPPAIGVRNSANASDKHKSVSRRFNVGGTDASRFRTQPITTEEVREAMVTSPRVRHSASTTDTRSTGASPRPYRNGYSNDSQGVVVVVKGSDSDTRVPKGILKNSREASQDGDSSRGIGSSDSEGGEVVKSILKVNLSVAPADTVVENNKGIPTGGRLTPPRGVLKKELAASNAKVHEPVRSILKPESEWSERRNSSSESSTATESSESSESESSELEEEVEGEAHVTQDIGSILRNVEMEARMRQRQKLGGAKGSEEDTNQSEAGVEGQSSEEGELEAGSSSSSGGREVRRIIRNEAVARRRNAGLIRTQMQQQKEEAKASGLPASAIAPLLKSRSAVTVGVLPSSSPPTAGSGPAKGSPFGGRKGLPGVQGSSYLDPVAALAAATTRPPGGLVPCQRSKTQPIPVRMTVPGAEGGDGAEECIQVGGSIAERLAALQKSGQHDWRKRVSRLNPEEELTEATQNHNGSTPTGRVRSKSERGNNNHAEIEEPAEAKPKGILADRKGKLVEAAEGWRNRVEPSDAIGFSVAGRMGVSTHTPTVAAPLATTPSTSPLPLRKTKKTPRPARFRSKTTTNLATEAANLCSTPVSSHTEEFPYSLKRSISAPGCEDGELGLAGACRVGIPRADDETFTEFFKGLSVEQAWKEQLDLEVDDFDFVSCESRELLVQKRTVRKQQRRLATSKNPVKALAERRDLKEEYIEIKSTGVAERELRRLKVEKLAVNSTLAVEALAGLASKEDFTAVSLRKATLSPSGTSLLPYKHPMLLLVKGRRHVQTRLVEPVAKSINHGDAFILITNDEVYNWIGEFSNVIERSRSAEIAARVHQKKDLGCSGSSHVIQIGGGAVGSVSKPTCTSSQIAKFWKILGSEDGSSKASEAGHPDEDELYESSIVDTNIVYEVKGEELVPIEESCGAIPKIQLLDPSKVLVFDFGSELYVWNGKNATQNLRKLGMKLVKELWEEGCDYSEYDASPFVPYNPFSNHENGSATSKGKNPRPTWALLGKVNQHMETILFREKFLDWPDFSRVIRVKSGSDEEEEVKNGKNGSHFQEVLPCNAKEMIEGVDSTADLELEGSHLGRGDLYNDEEGRRLYEIATLGVTMWHISEFEHEEVSAASIGQFHSDGTYVVRWLYQITVSGRELSGGKSKHALAGRDRCAYFCWQGRDASLNEKGAAALLTVELDKEKGPQVRLTQGTEPPAFLRIFKGCMVVHRGRRGEEGQIDSSATLSRMKRSGWRLYLCRSAFDETEALLEEVKCGMRHLRSRASFALIHAASGTIYLWHGAKSHQRTRKIALSAVENVKENMPPEFSFPSEIDVKIKEIEEGSEPKEFFEALGGGNRQLYSSLVGSKLPFDHSPRLFHLSSIASGSFEFNEIYGPWRAGNAAPGGVPWNTDIAPQPFPFLQSDLYSASQPSLFMLDNHHEIWLWQGWWPEEDSSPGDSGGEEECRVLGDGHVRGSRAVRWQAERRAAMQTVLDYANLKAKSTNRSKPKAWLVWAGLEPHHFTNLFPEWTDRDDVAEINIREGKGGDILPVEQELARLTRSTYPPAQLLQRPLPEGVDPTRLELYLSPQHFQELLGMSKEEFDELPSWKQTNVKKEVGLF